MYNFINPDAVKIQSANLLEKKHDAASNINYADPPLNLKQHLLTPLTSTIPTEKSLSLNLALYGFDWVATEFKLITSYKI